MCKHQMVLHGPVEPPETCWSDPKGTPLWWYLCVKCGHRIKVLDDRVMRRVL